MSVCLVPGQQRDVGEKHVSVMLNRFISLTPWKVGFIQTTWGTVQNLARGWSPPGIYSHADSEVTLGWHQATTSLKAALELRSTVSLGQRDSFRTLTWNQLEPFRKSGKRDCHDRSSDLSQMPHLVPSSTAIPLALTLWVSLPDRQLSWAAYWKQRPGLSTFCSATEHCILT